MSEPVPPGGKHALLIGIDRYPNLSESQQLKGCVNDAHALERVLAERFAFPSGGIVVLENEAATRDGIRTALGDLLRRVRPGDTVVLSYSGHGSRRKNEDKPEGWDESLVPHDSGRDPHPNLDLPDDEIHDWLLDLAGITPAVTLVFDSCFSGGIARDPFETAVRWLPPDPRPAGSRPDPSAGSAIHRGGSREASGWSSLAGRYALIAGCRHDECAREIRLIDGESTIHHGALTYFLCSELKSAGAESASREIFERAAAAVTSHFPGQHPQLEGAWDRELFGSRVFDTMGFLPVRDRRDGHLVLAGGAAHGLTVGSEWAIYKQGTRRVAPETPCLGRVKVLGVQAVTAETVLLEEAVPDSIAAGDRAVEVAHDYGEMRLVVEVSGPDTAAADLAALRTAIGASRLLRAAAPGETGGARVYLIPPRDAVQDGDPAPQLGALRVPTWAVVGTGRLLAPKLPAAEGSLPRLLENLEIRARYELALKIENPDQESGLRDRVEARLLRQSGDNWIPAAPEDGGTMAYREGERLALEITNRSGHPVHVHVLDLGLTGRIALLYPPRGAREELLPEKTLPIGVRRGEELELFVPDVFPFDAGGPDEGIEHLKILATLEPTDFGSLVQGGVRAQTERSGRSGPLERLLAAALTGSPTRETRPVQTAPRDDWTAVSLSFLLRR